MRYFLFSAVATYKNHPDTHVGQFIAFEHRGFPSYRQLRILFHVRVAKVDAAKAEAEVDNKLKSLVVTAFSEFRSRNDFLSFTQAY